jgi:hypothetical protein
MHRTLDKRDEACKRSIFYACHPDAAGAASSHFRRNHNEGSVRSPPIYFDIGATQEGLVHLHFPAQTISVWPHHRPPKLLEPYPSCLVASQAQNPLQT